MSLDVRRGLTAAEQRGEVRSRRDVEPLREHVHSAVVPVLCVALAYIIVVVSRYAFLDDYALLASRLDGARSNFDIYLGSGRPLYGVAQWAVFGLFDTIDDMHWVRGVTLCFLLVLVALVHMSLRAWGASAWTASVVSAGMALLPTYQVTVSWATLFLAPAAAALAWGAAALVDSGRGRSTAGVVPRLLIAGAATTVAALVYQPSCMTYLVAVCAAVLVRRGVSSLDWPTGLRHMSVLGVAGVSSLTFLWAGQRATGRVGARTEVVTDFAGKARWLWGEVLPHALNPFSLTTKPVVSGVVALIALVGLLVHLRGSLLRRSAVLGGLCLLTLAAYAPSLVIAENWASNRSMLALQPAVFLMVCFGFLGVLKALPLLRVERFAGPLGVLLIFLLAARATANVTLYFVAPQTTELRLAEAAVLDALGRAGPIRVMQSTYVDSIAPNVLYDEFGLPSTAAAYVPAALCTLIVKSREAGVGCELVPEIQGVAPTSAISFVRLLAPLQAR